MSTVALSHLVIRVRDLEQAAETWKEVLGFVELDRHTLSEDGIHTVMLGPAGWSPRGGLRVELVAPLPGSDPTGAVAKRLAASGEGVHLLAVKATDLDSYAEGLRTRLGLTVVDGGAAESGPRLLVHPKSANGVLIEILQGDPT